MMEKAYWDETLETISKLDLIELEFRSLKMQLAYVYEKSPFYRQKFDATKIRPDDLKSLADLNRFPFTTKEEVLKSQNEYGGLGGHQCAPMSEVVRIQGTSGTTGTPLFIGLTRKDIGLWDELFARHAWTGGLRPDDVLINPFSFSLFAGGLSESSGAEHLGVTVIPAPFASTSTEKFMMLIETFRPTVLFSTPSSTVFLEDAVRKILKVEPKELGFIKGFMAGEALSEDERKRIEKTWGITARNFYGLADVAADISAECGSSKGMHFCAQNALVTEIIDPETLDPLPMASGVEGEIVFTTINREATPVIRYRVRDMVRIYTDPCPCGRTSFRFQVIGRSDDMIKVKGVNVFPAAVKGIIQSFSPSTTGEFRIVLPHPGTSFGDNLAIKVEYDDNLKKEKLTLLGETIRTKIREKLVFTPNIQWVPSGTFARSQYKVEYYEKEYET